jgi:glycosyltransferase involved in cell wall biosynthesis
MRVLHILKVKGIAGAENHLLTLLDGLRDHGIDALFLILVSPSNLVDEFMDAADARGIPARRLVIRNNFDLALISRIMTELRRFRPDIVHTHLLHGDLFAIPAAWLLRFPWFGGRGMRRPLIISSRHNDDRFRLRPYMRLINRLLWRMTDYGIAISEAVREFSIAIEGANPNKIETIYYGFDPPEGDNRLLRKEVRAEFGVQDDDIVVGTVSRLIEQKGLPYGLHAFALAAERHPQARLVIIGDGPLRSQLERQARALRVGDRVRFMGWRADGARMMAGLDIFLMPSLYEGFGLVLLEAMAQSVPIVGSAVSAIPEVVVHGETGLLVPPRDVPALAEALDLLMGDIALRKHMGMMGLERLETHFSTALMVERTLTLYRRLVRS